MRPAIRPTRHLTRHVQSRGHAGHQHLRLGHRRRNPWDFTAELSQDGTTLYLENTETSDQVSGGFDSSDDTTATLVSAVTQNVTAATDTSGTSCNLTLATSIALTLSDQSPPNTFSGTATYSYSVATAVSSNTDCTAQLSAAGGKYSTLPCAVTYSLKGTRQ